MKSCFLVLALLLSTRIISQNYIYTPTAIESANEEFGLSSAIGKSRHVLSFLLPENTVKWYYVYFAARNEADVKNIEQSFSLVAKLSTLYDHSGATSNIIQQISKPPSFNACDAIFLCSKNDGEVFESKGDYFGKSYMMIKELSRSNSITGIVEVADSRRQSGWQFLGFRNPATIYGVTVKVQVVAIVKTEEKINGWTKTKKEVLYNDLKEGFTKNIDGPSELKEKLVACLVGSLTKKYTPDSIRRLTSYELSDAVRKLYISCVAELKASMNK